jgi:predicted nucleotidyltransferase
LRRWRVQELAIFGSVLREEFQEKRDLDFFVTFAEDAEWSLLDHGKMQQELQELLGRPVDLLTRRAVEKSENWLRRGEILSTGQVIFGQWESG